MVLATGVRGCFRRNSGSWKGTWEISGARKHLPSDWNTIDLICFNGRSLHIVNGHVVMILKDSRYFENGNMQPLVKGKIQLQSEGAEVFYKDIKISQLASLPAEYEKCFN